MKQTLEYVHKISESFRAVYKETNHLLNLLRRIEAVENCEVSWIPSGA